MKKTILIVFGKPGAGKSYVAEILEKQFGYYSFNGDDALPTDMKEKLFHKGTITANMRSRFLANMIDSIKKLARQHNKLIVHQTFLREFMRKQIIDALPDAKFLLVETDDAIREKRYMKRKYFNLGLAYLRRMTGLFEQIHIPHLTIQNNIEGPQHIMEQVSGIAA